MSKEFSYTLGIDFGSQNIGIALIRHSNQNPNEPVYAGTLRVDTGGQEGLPTKVNDRKTARRMRRTQSTKKRRLRLLKDSLNSLGIAEEAVNSIVSFSKRRGYSWIKKDEGGYRKKKKEEEIFPFGVSRKAFLSSLEIEIEKFIPEEKREQVFQTCKNILDKEPEEDIRPARFDNRNPSKCRWDDGKGGCNNNVPAARNAVDMRLSQSFYVKLLPVFDSIENEILKREVCGKFDSYITDFCRLATKYQKLSETEKIDKEEEKKLNKEYSKKKSDFKTYLLSLEKTTEKKLIENLKKNFNDYYGKEIDNIVKKQQSGRVSFCREHSPVFIQYMLSHKAIPYKENIEDEDIKSRQQQILFSKIWRYVEARLLPLTNGKIDEIAVERNAFDLLAIPFEDKREMNEKKANELYWYGPRYGYNNDTRKMLFTEFDGYCCYCGEKFSESEFTEVEHILPRSKFGFDNYFNVVLACKECNAQKDNKTGLEFKPIHPKAYNAYCKYVDDREKQKLRHIFHTIKKGILNLLTKGYAKAETQLSIIGQNLLEATTTQRGPRPLARFLSQQISNACGTTPEIRLVNGRHTAVYRRLIFPDFDKLAEKLDVEKEATINHAIDAMLVAFQVPPYAWHERGFYDYKDYEYWAERVKNFAPKKDVDGFPEFSPPEPIVGFEKPSTANSRYYSIDILSTVWNRKHMATHKQEPYGMSNKKNTTKEGVPIRKEPASAVLKDILDFEKAKIESKKKLTEEEMQEKRKDNLRNYLERISNSILKEQLLSKLNGDSPFRTAAKGLIEWLQTSIKKTMKGNIFSSHPSSQIRKEYLEKFISADANDILMSPQTKIPPNVSIRMAVSPNMKGQINLKRRDKIRPDRFHHYMSQPNIKMKIIAYRADSSGAIDKQNPAIFDVMQSWQVLINKNNKKEKIIEDGNHVLNGRILSNGVKEKDFLKEWETELKKYLMVKAFKQWYRITQGNYLEYETGDGFFIRNFKDVKRERFRGILKVWRSPYNWLANS
ncbi:MAG: HNH endonuclease [Nitrospirota bacterium]